MKRTFCTLGASTLGWALASLAQWQHGLQLALLVVTVIHAVVQCVVSARALRRPSLHEKDRRR